MTMQTNITDKAVRLIPTFLLLSLSLSVPADGAVIAQGVAVNPATVNAGEPADRLQDSSPAGGVPGLTAAQLETVRENGKQQAAEAAFALGIAAMDRNDLAAAQALIREAVQLQPTHPGYLQAAAGLAFHKGDFAAAQAYQVQGLALAQAALGPDDIRVAQLMDDLGTIYLARQHYTQAERTWQESLAIHEQILGKMHPSIASRLNDLAGLAMRDGRFDETEQLLKRALHILEADAATERTDVAIARHNLADFYVHRQRPAEADALYRKALADWKAVPAPQRLQIAASLNEVGRGYLDQRRLEEARSQFELVIGLLEEDYGQDHPDVRSARTALDNVNSAQEKLGQREVFDQRMFEELRSQFLQRSRTM